MADAQRPGHSLDVDSSRGGEAGVGIAGQQIHQGLERTAFEKLRGRDSIADVRFSGHLRLFGLFGLWIKITAKGVPTFHRRVPRRREVARRQIKSGLAIFFAYLRRFAASR
jgi:hypothetical protein